MRGPLPRAYVPTSNKSILEANKCLGLDLYALHYGTTGGSTSQGMKLTTVENGGHSHCCPAEVVERHDKYNNINIKQI